MFIADGQRINAQILSSNKLFRPVFQGTPKLLSACVLAYFAFKRDARAV